MCQPPSNADIRPIHRLDAKCCIDDLPHLTFQYATLPKRSRYVVSFFEATSSHLFPRLSPFLLMFALEEPKSRKRRLSSQEPWDVEPETIAKKQKSLSECRDVPRHRRRSPSFWDTLSKIRLSRSSLREFERRNIGKKIQSPYTPTTKIEYPTGRSRLRLKRFARRGGPDLSHLRGVCLSHVDVSSPRRLTRVCDSLPTCLLRSSTK